MSVVTNIIRVESFSEAGAQLARYFSGTYSVLRAPNEMAELWMEKRLAPVVDSLPQDFLADYEHWKRWKHDGEGGCVLHVLVDDSSHDWHWRDGVFFYYGHAMGMEDVGDIVAVLAEDDCAAVAA